MILIVIGTNRQGSYSEKVAELVAHKLIQLNAQYQVLDLAKLPDSFTATALYHNQGKNNEFNTFIDLVDNASKFIFIIPEYNGSYPGILKAFMDGLRFPSSMQGKWCGLIGLSAGSSGAALALSHFTDVLHYLGANVLPIKPRVPEVFSQFKSAKFMNSKSLEIIDNLLDDIVKKK